MKLNCAALIAFVVSCCALPAAAQPRIGVNVAASGLSSPVFVTACGDGTGRLFVVEQTGRIRIVTDGVVLSTPFLDLMGIVESGGEKGLLGLAFHPEYAENGYFYVNYTYRPSGKLMTRVSRFSVSIEPDRAEVASEQKVIEFEQPFSNHNGGMLAFGPNDGYLYISTGDGGSANDPNGHAQDLHSYLGKILRLDVDGGSPYAVPPDNPFDGGFFVYPEVWAYGLRNPWRFSFDRLNGDLYIGDVGQGAREEVDYQHASSSGGENYGWRVFEGTLCNTPTATAGACEALSSVAIGPVHEYTHTDGFSITGGYVYRGEWLPDLQGKYIFADYGSARVWSFVINGGGATEFEEWTSRLDPEGTRLDSLSSFGEDGQGELYLTSLGGTVYRLEPVHMADRNQDFAVNLTELLRIIQFFNTGAHHCDAGTEDGYAPGAGDTTCALHDSDYSPADWRVNLSELLRVIQFFNWGRYAYCGDTEDGFCIR